MNKLELILPSMEYGCWDPKMIYMKMPTSEMLKNICEVCEGYPYVWHAFTWPSNLLCLCPSSLDAFLEHVKNKEVDIEYELVSCEQLYAENPDWVLVLTQFNVTLVHTREFFRHAFSFQSESGIGGYDPHSYLSYARKETFVPDAFICHQYPHRRAQTDEAFAVWWKTLPLVYETHKLVKQFSAAGYHETLPGTAVYRTDATMNLKWMLDFCYHALNSNADFGWSENDLKLIMDIIAILANYQHIDMVAQFFIGWQEELDYYVEQSELATALLKLRKEQIDKMEGQ